MKFRRVTQQDIARKAGLTRAAVSMALKHHPSIPERTRERIVRLAEHMGYTPDPMLAALAAYRSGQRPAIYRGTLAWLVNSSFGFDWRNIPQFAEYHEGAATRATHHGYQLEIFNLHPSQMTQDRLASIFRARNITGLLLCPQPRSETTLDLPWQYFSSVTFGYTLSSPHLNTVISTQYQDMVLTMRQMQLRGYRRIGLMLSQEHDLRTNHNYHAGFLVAQLATPPSRRVPPFTGDYSDHAKFAAWLRRCRPDSVVACGGRQCLETFRKLGTRYPQDLGVALPNLAKATPQVAGVVEKSTEIGSVAVDVLVAMMQRGERGVPESPLRIHVEGQWHDGRSLRPPALPPERLRPGPRGPGAGR